LTPGAAVEHAEPAVALVRHLSAVLLAFALVVANVGTCPGWEATPDARMACCEKGVCPMRDAGAKGAKDSKSGHALTQAQADGCCASSEREESDSSNSTVLVTISSAVLGDGVTLPASIPSLVLRERGRAAAPLPTPPVPRHVLLSVFLV
jgi:hypothetical protein